MAERFCIRHGINGERATAWMNEMTAEGMPGEDFMVLAPSSAYDQWLQRPAEYSDFRRAVHFLFHTYLGMTQEMAICYNPHSFRHFLIESAQQLRAMKYCSTDEVERLGRWKKGSDMPEAYDNQSGVSDLLARHRVLSVLTSGWRPATEGELPSLPPIP